MFLRSNLVRAISDNIKQNLVITLDKEIAYQKKQLKLEENLLEFLTTRKLKLISQHLKSEVILKGANYEVKFCSRPLFANLTPENYLYEGTDDRYRLQDIPYSIKVLKKNNHIEYIIKASGEKLYISNIIFVSGEHTLVHSKYQDLHPDTQKEFINILEQLGLTSNLFEFIEGYSLYRDDQLNIEWMSKVKKFILG